MATNYDINYNDSRFTEVEADKKAALSEVEKTYGGMINSADKYYDKQIQAAQDYADKQSAIQQQQTDFAIQQIEQQKAEAKQDYTKEQSGAYVDWQKQSNQYGANAEQMAAQGMQNTGYSESSQVSMYNTYQNRVATARESYNRAVLNYNNAIKDARLQNNAALAEIAYNALQKQLELSLQGFQYKNQLLIEQSNKKFEVDKEYNSRYQDVLSQINQENALAEEVRQYNEKMAEEKRQFNESMALEKEQFAWQKAQAAAKYSGGGDDGDGNKKITKDNDGDKDATIKKSDNVYTPPKSGVVSDLEKKVNGVSNKHTQSWIEIPGHGRFTWTEVYAHVKDGSIKETTTSNGKLKYTWVSKPKTAKNVTPDAKGYAAKQKDLFGFNVGL